jgi:hypothetical protein
MEVKLKLSSTEHKDLTNFCNLNDLLISEVVKKSFTTGFHIEKYGLLNNGEGEEKIVEKEVEVIKYVEVPTEVVKYVEVPVEIIKEVEVIKEIEKEVIREVPVEIIKEKVLNVIKEVPVEKVVIKEVVKEIPVEKIVTKTEYVSDNTQINELLLKIQQLEDTPPKVIEVIKEVPVDKVVIKEVVKEVPVEVIVEKEVIKEVEVEVIVEKEVEKTVVDNSKTQMLQETIQKMRNDLMDKDKKIKELEQQKDALIQSDLQRGAVYLRGSNLNDTLYK